MQLGRVSGIESRQRLRGVRERTGEETSSGDQEDVHDGGEASSVPINKRQTMQTVPIGLVRNFFYYLI